MGANVRDVWLVQVRGLSGCRMAGLWMRTARSFSSLGGTREWLLCMKDSTDRWAKICLGYEPWGMENLVLWPIVVCRTDSLFTELLQFVHNALSNGCHCR